MEFKDGFCSGVLSDDKKMEVIAIVYVNLITGECDLIEKKI